MNNEIPIPQPRQQVVLTNTDEKSGLQYNGGYQNGYQAGYRQGILVGMAAAQINGLSHAIEAMSSSARISNDPNISAAMVDVVRILQRKAESIKINNSMGIAP